ncbi:MAG: hypothetical protein K9G49_06660 [Taibaiella sp.]|nr:hypothetical protein [Taibaiella sp.]
MCGCSKIALILLTIFGSITHAGAQDVFSGISDTSKKIKSPGSTVAPRQSPKGPKPIKKEISFGYRLNTAGWAMYMDYGSVKARSAKTSDMFYNVNFIQFELSEKKSPKQEKIVVEDNSTGTSSKYVYGKINNFYAVKLGYGFRKMLAGKPDPGSVSIHWSNVLGGSLGLLKPYYLNVYNATSDLDVIKYSDVTQSRFLQQQSIIGSAGFGTGLGEIKMIPGGHFKSMLHFDLSANRKSVVALETGVNIEYYSANVPLMLNQEANPYFVELFLAFQFGKRW